MSAPPCICNALQIPEKKNTRQVSATVVKRSPSSSCSCLCFRRKDAMIHDHRISSSGPHDKIKANLQPLKLLNGVARKPLKIYIPKANAALPAMSLALTPKLHPHPLLLEAIRGKALVSLWNTHTLPPLMTVVCLH